MDEQDNQKNLGHLLNNLGMAYILKYISNKKFNYYLIY